jgi:hypothetical protein
MRKTYFLFLVTGLIAGCGYSGAQNTPTTVETAAGASNEAQQPAKAHNQTVSWERLVMHSLKEGQGQVLIEMPFPASWKLIGTVKRGEPSIVGPNHIQVVDFPVQMFLYTGNPRMQQTYTQAGQRLRSMPGVERLVQEDWVPWGKSQGLEFIRQYELPEVTKIDKWYNDQLYKAVPMQTEVKAIGIDWKHSSSGHSYFIIMHLTASTTSELQTWSYYGNGLRAEDAVFDRAKKQYIFGLANAHYNSGPILAYNRSEAEKAGRSWAEFETRLARNRAAFEASQREFVNRSSAINESIMKGFNERNTASDISQERFLDTVNERENRVNASTGQRFKVDSGPNQYWVNAEGQYISTPNAQYDPNLDSKLNHHNWDQLKPAD